MGITKYFTDEARKEARKEQAKRMYVKHLTKRTSYQQAYYMRNKELIIKRTSAYYRMHKEEINRNRAESKTKYRLNNLDRFLGYKLKKFGLTLGDYKALLDKQNGACGICKVPFLNGVKGEGPHLDHDHITGKFRGILCHKCNTALGLFTESRDVLYAAITYLIGEPEC